MDILQAIDWPKLILPGLLLGLAILLIVIAHRRKETPAQLARDVFRDFHLGTAASAAQATTSAASPPVAALKSKPASAAVEPLTTGQTKMTTAEQIAAIDAAIANLQHQRAILTAPVAADPTKTPPAEPAPAPKWPHMITIDGINIMADADINPAWKATIMSKIIAGAFSGKDGGALADHYVFDPSNGKKIGQPVRSPAGFPLFYAIAGNVSVGTPSVLYGELSFNSDAEVAEYVARTTSGGDPVAQQAAWDAVFAQMAQPQTGQTPAVAGEDVPIS